MKKQKLDKRMRYTDLILQYMEIRSKLWVEDPDRMLESAKKSAELMLKRGLIQCEHNRTLDFEQKLEREGLETIHKQLDEFENRLIALEPTS